MARVSIRLLMALVVFMAACQGQSREKLMLQGNELMSQGNPKGAAVVFKNMLEKYPGDVPGTLALANAYLESGKPEQAEAELKANQEKVKADPAIPVLTARILIAQRKPAEALDALKPALAGQAGGDVLEQAGHASLLLGDVNEAIAFYKDALAKDPRLDRAQLALAEAYMSLKQFDDARTTLDSLLATAPKNKNALLMLAQLQTMAGEEDALLATYGKLVAYYPSDPRIRYTEAFLKLSRKKDLDYAETVSAKLITDAPKASEGYKLKGLVFLARNQAPLAIEPLMSANKIRQDLDTNLFLAQAYAQTGNLETAVSHLQTVLTRVPGQETARRMLASIYLRQNRLDEAIAETQKIFAKHPEDEASRMIMAEAYVAKRDLDKGLEIFSQIAEDNDKSPALFLKKGMLLALKGDDAGAEADLRKAVELGGKVLEPRLYLSAFLAGKNRIDEAVEVLDSGLNSGPGAALALNAMAKLRLRQGKLDLAKELLARAKSTDPKVLTTYYNLAALATAAGKIDESAAEFEAALAIKNDDLRSLLGAASCREALGQFDQAQALLERAAKDQNPNGALALAEFYARRKQGDKAVSVLDLALTTNPKAIPLWLLKARLHAVAGDQEKALSALGRVETLNQRVGLLEKAKLYLSLKQSAKALEMAERIRSMNMASGDYALPLAEVQLTLGQAAEAMATLQKASSADPGNPRVLVEIAKLSANGKQTAKALSTVDQAMAAGLDPATGHALKGSILLQANDPAKAATEYEVALRHNERLPLALNNLAMIYADREGSPLKALELALRAYSLAPNNPSVLDTLGYSLIKNGRSKEALMALERAEKLAQGNPDIARHIEMARAAQTGVTPGASAQGQ